LCRTVKCLYFDTQEAAVYIGGSKGLVRFGPDFSRSAWTTDDGLISNEVNHIVRLCSGELAIATGGGLSIVDGGTIRSIYAFHGLINNRVFALQPMPVADAGGEEVLAAGTLGGISLVSRYQVVAQITPENSRLPVHWITALLGFEGSLLIGTYGGGLALRGPNGDWIEMPEMLTKLEINPNALWLDSDLLLAGTLDRGMAVLRRTEGEWELIGEGLSSLNVTAFSADEERIFIGTDNGIVVVDKGRL
jgi:ligand-binding sensor domain-containing protein